MLEGEVVASALAGSGVTHVVWIPDSTLGKWDEALSSNEELTLVRVCREGEAFAVAAGLWLGGKKPVIMIQCTGMFEAGDSLRNFIHDLKIPLFVIIGLRNYYGSLAGTSRDTAPQYAEKILGAWDVPFSIFEQDAPVERLIESYIQFQKLGESRAIFIGE